MTVSDEVIDKVLEDIIGYTKDELLCETKVLKKIASELLQRRQADRWVPVEERLPEDGYYSLVVADGFVTIGKHYSGISTWSWQGYDIPDVTHWRPLPEPPEVPE